MTDDEAVAALDAVLGGDPEGAHGMADDILLALAPESVRSAYERVMDRCAWWACA